eukprot:TRINITY_DN399_c1_g1_i1.p1 TRINITY_DN399_c1_g1~~TRINITY_DN399_c1_g1_i1.p1  ORF type:complete len:420 (-),score=201.84 TRINITY_DN399_c1_g1_i1:610-1869(-)
MEEMEKERKKAEERERNQIEERRKEEERKEEEKKREEEKKQAEQRKQTEEREKERRQMEEMEKERKKAEERERNQIEERRKEEERKEEEKKREEEKKQEERKRDEQRKQTEERKKDEEAEEAEEAEEVEEEKLSLDESSELQLSEEEEKLEDIDESPKDTKLMSGDDVDSLVSGLETAMTSAKTLFSKPKTGKEAENNLGPEDNLELSLGEDSEIKDESLSLSEEEFIPSEETPHETKMNFKSQKKELDSSVESVKKKKEKSQLKQHGNRTKPKDKNWDVELSSEEDLFNEVAETIQARPKEKLQEKKKTKSQPETKKDQERYKERIDVNLSSDSLASSVLGLSDESLSDNSFAEKHTSRTKRQERKTEKSSKKSVPKYTDSEDFDETSSITSTVRGEVSRHKHTTPKKTRVSRINYQV